ncbi:hypothetical protein TNCV_2475801 [Trichonephila clavipes]|nr:hypothetical protein TNCV_2475801 [Trichonephila clavipes]
MEGFVNIDPAGNHHLRSFSLGSKINTSTGQHAERVWSCGLLPMRRSVFVPEKLPKRGCSTSHDFHKCEQKVTCDWFFLVYEMPFPSVEDYIT